MSEPLVLLDDATDGVARTTETLLASLVVRVRTLALISGSQAVGSLVAGVAALGREAALGTEGARLRSALERSRAGSNADAIWAALHLGDLASMLPPSPVLEDLRNDVSLLAAPDVERALADLDEAAIGAGIGLVREPQRVEALDFLVGLWALGRFLGDAVELLAGRPEPDAAPVPPADAARPEEGPLLR